jgi:hypothetical protein
VVDHLAIDDAVYDDLREHFSEDALVALGLHCELCVGLETGNRRPTRGRPRDLPAIST